MTEVAIRAGMLYVPMLMVAAAVYLRPPTRRQRNAAMLACIWLIPTLLVVHVLAGEAGWWTISMHGGANVLGMPIELLAGWMLFWGALPVIAAPRLPLPVVVAAVLVFDLWMMPLCAPVVTLGPSVSDGATRAADLSAGVAIGRHWLIGEVVAIVIGLIPAQLFARWTLDDRRLVARATLQVVCVATLTLWLLPTLVFDRMDAAAVADAASGAARVAGAAAAAATAAGGAAVHSHGWRVLGTYDARWLQIALQLVALAALPGLSAVQEFVRRGGGTPVPFDPPRRLVTTGIYGYVANPMQLSAALTLIAWGVLVQNVWVAGASVMALIYGSGLAAWDERRDLTARFGERWLAYRREVHDWRPRWRPYVASDAAAENASGTAAAAATLYVAFTCGKCSEIGDWVQRQRPRGLRIVPAEQHPSRDLWRMTYAGTDGVEDEGIAALARALEHIDLRWAIAGMFLRLPLIRPCVQALVDMSGGGPQRIARVCLPPPVAR